MQKKRADENPGHATEILNILQKRSDLQALRKEYDELTRIRQQRNCM